MKNMNDMGCTSCSKEPSRAIPTARIFETLNELFSKNDLPAVGRLLSYWESEARALRDERGLLEILNEQIGYYRRTADAEKGLAVVAEAFELIETKQVCDTVSAGTIYLNGATTMKSFGKTAEAMLYYEKAREIYEQTLDADDYKLAALYNNVSSAYKDLGKPELAEESCYRAIEILKGKEDCHGEIAVTLVNIAHLYHEADPFDERINEIMDKAWEHLMSDKNQRDGDFAFLCSKCHPSFGFFGYFEREAELKAWVEKIYAGN